MSEETVQIKRGRGRPKGSKNKPKVALDVVPTTPTAIEAVALAK